MTDKTQTTDRPATAANGTTAGAARSGGRRIRPIVPSVFRTLTQ